MTSTWDRPNITAGSRHSQVAEEFRWPYEYRKLSSENDQIRLLGLLPGDWHSPIEATLYECTFTEYRYEALSYTWGDPNDRRPIYVVDERSSWYLEVTRSCEEALRHIRDQVSTSLILWIDAICINQEDLEERGQQVTLMSKIYHRAAKVIAWIGPASEDSHVAIGWIKETAARLGVADSRSDSEALDNEFHLQEPPADLEITVSQLEAFDRLIERPWFDRLWIWQEIKLGRGNATLLCGHLTLPWTLLRAVTRHMSGKVVPDIPSLSKHGKTFILLLKLCNGPEVGLLNALIAMNACQCSDQRDRIYTAQTFCARVENGAMIAPDYTMSVEEVYTRSAVTYALYVRSLDFLRFVQHPRSLHNLPSWVPDWTIERQHWYDIGQAGSFSRAPVNSAEYGALEVRGQRIARVEDVMPCTISSTDFGGSDTRVEKLTALFCSVVPGKEETEIRRLAHIAGVGRQRERWDPPSITELSSDEVEAAITSLLLAEAVPSDRTVLWRLSRRLSGRAILRCHDGELAVGPAAAQRGDMLAVILGCALPIVLRDTGTQGFHVLGPAYCEGVMAGEALLGPLPDSYEMIQAHDAWKEYRTAFRNRQTGQIRWEDPRIPELPAEWEIIVQHEGHSPPWYVHRETGEKRYYKHDPRCDADALQARGVELETFTLI